MNRTGQIINWIARVFSLASIGLLTAFILGGVNEGTAPTMSEWFGLACFPGAVIVGLAWGWWSPRQGGLLALNGLLAFYLWHSVSRSSFPSGPYFLLFTSPAILYLLATACRQKPVVETAS
ncbi:MAG: hypothetical protein AAF497_13900 [Planctomycetota bacterium]